MQITQDLTSSVIFWRAGAATSTNPILMKFDPGRETIRHANADE